MKKNYLIGLLLCLSISSFALNIKIVESTSFNSGHVMDGVWNGVALSMGHTPTIVPQTTLDNNAFFATTDILIVSSGVINLPANRVATILAFLQTGKPVYLQCEYLSSYNSNQAFASIISSLGGTFTWTVTMAGTLAPMTVLGSFATTNNNVPSISYYWYSVPGNGDCNTIPFLLYNNANHGWQYVPANPLWGNIIATTDQDWVNQSTSLPLMQNIITHLINPGFIPGPSGGVNLGNDTTICTGNQLILNATSSGSTYLWQDNSTNPTYTVTAPGTYFVSVTGTCGTSRDTIIVGVSPPPVMSLGNDTTICQSGTITLNATTSNATYLWSNSATTPTITVSTSGTYWAEVTVNGCSARDSIVVNFVSANYANLGNDTTLCVGQNTILNGGSATNYLWSTNATTPTIIVNTPGTYWVQLSTGQCSSSDTINVAFSPAPNVNLGNDTALCTGDQLILDATTSGASYLWSDNSTNANLTVSTSGTYWAQVTVNGCSASDSIQVNFNPAPVANLGNDITLCAGQNTILNGGSATNYLWSNNATSQTITVSTSGTYWLELSTGQCSSSDTINVTFLPLPIVNLGNDTSLCTGDQLMLDATTSTATYLWSNSSTNATITVSTSGTYWANVTVNGCSARDSILVSFVSAPVANLGTDITLCEGQNTVLNGGSASNYLWSDNATFSTITVNTSGTYWVQLSIGQCASSDTIVVTFLAVPNVNLGNDFALCIGQTTNLNAGTANNYLWSDGSTTSSITIANPGTYWVVANNNQCADSDTIVITSEDCQVIITLPNVFTPNSDGSNDQFTPVIIKGISAMNTSIYNRWGELVYSTNDLSINWNGKVDGGNDAVDGVYYWVINYTDLLGVVKDSSGFVTLIRSPY